MVAVSNDGVFSGYARKGGDAQATGNDGAMGVGASAKSVARLSFPVDVVESDPLPPQHAQLINTYDGGGRMALMEWDDGGGDSGGGGGGDIDPGGTGPVVEVPGTPEPEPDPIPVVVVPGTREPEPSNPATPIPTVPVTPGSEPPEPPIPVVVIKGQRPVTRYVSFMNQQALATYSGQCAKYVRQGLEAAGYDTSGHPVAAKDYGPTLLKNGFTEVPKAGYVPKAGDTVVFQNYPGGSAAGHIEMFNGSRWVSDTIQPNFLANAGYANASYVIYRPPGN